MTKTAKAPRNFYTATEAIKKLGMPRATFFNLAKSGKIKRVVPDGYTEGYYPKSEIDKMALAREMFTLQYASDTSIFRRAEEKDIRGITDLGVALFGTSTTPSYESRLACWKKNPDAYYVIEQDDLIVGWIAMVPMKEEAIAVLMGETKSATFMFVGMHQNVMVPENILPFIPDGAKNVFLTIGARQGLPQSRTYGMRLILGGYEVLENFARKGIFVERLYATSRTPDGVKLCKEIGFQEKENNATSAVKRFWLDLATSNSPLLREYQEIVKEMRRNAETVQPKSAEMTAKVTAKQTDVSTRARKHADKKDAQPESSSVPK